jgi:hypothetical protein
MLTAEVSYPIEHLRFLESRAGHPSFGANNVDRHHLQHYGISHRQHGGTWQQKSGIADAAAVLKCWPPPSSYPRFGRDISPTPALEAPLRQADLSERLIAGPAKKDDSPMLALWW